MALNRDPRIDFSFGPKSPNPETHLPSVNRPEDLKTQYQPADYNITALYPNLGSLSQFQFNRKIVQSAT